MWFHQHFNSGTTPARYLAFKHEGVAIRNAQGVPKAWISRRIGGDQIDYIDEKPEVRRMFATALAKHGLNLAHGCRPTPRKRRARRQDGVASFGSPPSSIVIAGLDPAIYADFEQQNDLTGSGVFHTRECRIQHGPPGFQARR